jgi:hypothetical protein
MPPTAPRNISYFDERPFKFECSISAGSETVLSIRQSSIIHLEIKESIFNAFPEGILIIDNIGSGVDSGLVFYGDNFTNLLYVKMRPVHIRPNGKIEDMGPDRDFNIEEIFSIYKVEDLPSGEHPVGSKKIYFRHILANELRIKKNSFTVGDFLGGGDISSLSDNQRAVKTGIILEKLLGDRDPQFRGANFKINPFEWDQGKNTMFPNWCPGTETLYDSIQKVYQRHVSEAPPNDKCYLKYNRGEKTKDLSLISMAALLRKNIELPESYFMETLLFGHYSDSESTNRQKQYIEPPSNIKRPKINKGDSLVDLSNIRSFKLYDLSAENLEKDITINIPAITDYENITRYNLGERDILNIYDLYKKYYIDDPFGTLIEGGRPFPMIIRDSVRHKLTTQYNKVIHTPYKSWEHAYDVEVNASILSALLFKGLQCTLSLRGSPHRTIGKFIDIDLRDTNITLKFVKIPGRWLVTECTHIITRDKYWNSLSCIKTYRNC